MSQLDDLTAKVIKIQQERNWKQFHAPKNIAIALVAEAGELAALYRFSDTPVDPAKLTDEVGDVFYNLLLFAHEAGLDISQALDDTVAKIETKYPADKWRGKAHKYNESA